MELLVSASFIAAFLAGVAALFAPCCVTVLLPTYLASIFKNRTTVFLMTFVFFLGLLTIFLPIGLGAVALTQFFSAYHTQIFALGGLFLIFLGLTLVLGMQLALPIKVNPELRRADLASVYVLGIFSGVATSCCAPVLAGVMALAVLPGSFILGAAYTVAYVLGMVAPLFVLSALIDKTKVTENLFLFRRAAIYHLPGKTIRVTYSNLFSGLMFLLLGAYILNLAIAGDLTSHNDFQITINLYLTDAISFLGSYTKFVPEVIWAIFFIGVSILIVRRAFNQFRNLEGGPDESR